MGGVIYAAPGPAGNTIRVHSAAVDRLAAVSRKLRTDVLAIRSNPFDSDYKEAFSFFASIRALAGIIGLLAEQPGYRPTDADGQAIKAQMAPLKAKMDEITKQIESKVDLMNPLPVTAAKKVEIRATDAGRMAGILHDADSVRDIKDVRDDKSIPESWKAEFFEELGKSIHEAMVEVLKTKHEDQMFDAVTQALHAHSEDTMIGACLWASQGATVAAGNLPGPNSIYVGAVRIAALKALKTVKDAGPDAVLDDILPHYFKALKFSTEEQNAFEDAFKRFKQHHAEAQIETDANGVAVARARAQKVFDEELAGSLKAKGSLQAGPVFSGAMTILNLVCLYGVWKSTPGLKDFNARNVADLALAGANAGAGICATLVRMRWTTEMMVKLVEHPSLGYGLGLFAAVVNICEGFATVVDGFSMPRTDWWMVFSGGAQMASGVLLAIGVCCSLPGVQMLGVVASVFAGAFLLIGDAMADKMVRFVSQLIKQIKEAKSTYDNSALMISVGVQTLVDELEKLVVSCDVHELDYNMNWTGPGGLVISKDIVHDRLNALGIISAAQRDALVRAEWAH